MKATIQKTMKAVRIHAYGGPEVLVYEDVPTPSPGPGEVLLRVRAAGVNPVDWKIRDGLFQPAVTYQFPLIPGWEASGTIEDVGPGVTGVEMGAAVYTNLDPRKDGAYAQFATVDRYLVAPKPGPLDWIHAGATPLAGLTAWQALFDVAGLSAYQTILIHGAAGGVGSFAVQLAKWRGAEVIATASAHNHDFLRDLGADEVIDYHSVRFEEVVKDVEVVLDTVGGDTLARSYSVIKEGGWLVSIVDEPSEELAAKYDIHAQLCMMTPRPGQLAELGRLLDREEIRPIVTTVFPLHEARKAQELSQSGHTRGKIVLQVD